MMEDKLIIKCHSTLEGEKEIREGVRGEELAQVYVT